MKIRKKSTGIFLPHITERKLLARVKQLCAECGFDNPNQYKSHTFRNHFASMCANHGVAHRKALAWLGHSSSDMLDLYYHLHDEDSQNTMQALAAGRENMLASNNEKASNEGSLRAVEESKIEKTLQVPEFQELIATLSNITEGGDSNPRNRFIPVQRFSKPLADDCNRLQDNKLEEYDVRATVESTVPSSQLTQSRYTDELEELGKVIYAWPELPEAVRATILCLVDKCT